MINQCNVFKYCCDDISLIENYDKAINSNIMWVCHHKLEIQGEKRFSKIELIESRLYYNRPASELIFMTASEHMKLHTLGIKKSPKHKRNIAVSLKGRPSPMTGKHHSKETKNTISLNGVGKHNHTGENNPMYGKHQKQYKWLTPTGEIKVMNKTAITRFHPNWKLIEESI